MNQSKEAVLMLKRISDEVYSNSSTKCSSENMTCKEFDILRGEENGRNSKSDETDFVIGTNPIFKKQKQENATEDNASTS